MTDSVAQARDHDRTRDRPAAPARGLVDFARALRAAGAQFGPAALLDANAALVAVGPERRADVRAALRATLVRDPSEFEFFELLFDSFYPVAEAPVDVDAPVRSMPNPAPRPAERRWAESIAGRGEARPLAAAQREDEDASGTDSGAERLKKKDFEQMSAAELVDVKALIKRLARAQALRRSRRNRNGGKALDLRAMLRRRDLDQPRYRRPVPRPRDCVLIVDISGSMSVYSRLFLHFAHALSRCPGRVETFVFATRLSRLTRTLRITEPDLAIAAATQAAPDWDGGTRLGTCLAEFNLRWARRVLGGGARVVLLSDGLERDAVDLLEQEAARLARTAHELIWINPLLRSREYAPLAAGARVLVRHADTLRAAHNVASLAELARLLD
jgi:uncharacterized protein with von Willebrand factor type A (vWA) domain